VKSTLFIGEGFASAQQFGVNLGEFFQLFQQLAIVVYPDLGRLLLGQGFELELVDFAHGQTLRQKVIRAVLGTALMTVTASLAARGEPLDDRGAQAIRSDLELGQQKVFAVAQSQGGLALVRVYPCHV